jgi:exonuclease VII small subunit
MKIENTDRSQPLSPKPAEKTGSRDTRAEFVDILQKTVQTKGNNSVAQPSLSPPIRPVEFTAQPETTFKAARETGEILDTLETYQQLLAKPSASLRKLQPVVEQLEQEADRMAASLNHLPKGHALRQIMSETLIQVNQEVERFNQGEYISNELP